MNFIQIAGFLGADAEERFTSSGKKVISLRVATKVKQGGKEETIWWRVTIWGDRFDKMVPYLKKGSPVIVVGELSKPETYVDKNGVTQVSLTITAEIIKFSPFGKSERDGAPPSHSGNGQQTPDPFSGSPAMGEEMASYGAATRAQPNYEEALAGDDLPF